MDLSKYRHVVEQVQISALRLLWKECQPKILVVADGLDFSPTNGFGLTQFVDALTSGTIHGMTPLVVKAARGTSLSGADLQNFSFADATVGVKKSLYDVVFLFGIAGENQNPLGQSEIDALATFMQAGGGVFATGDHEDLGAAMGRDVPRVRTMRHWTLATTPDVANVTRLSTNFSGPSEAEEFEDQSDNLPQRLYPNFRTDSAPLGTAHPVLQLPLPHKVLEIYPDHPHEGECVVPASLTTTFQLQSATVDEWPFKTGSTTMRVSPEAVGMTMSHGTGFAPKAPLLPRSFIAICAYDGQKAGVGRVVTDATWHHFVNINLDGTGAPNGYIGLQTPGPLPTDDLLRMREYYRNLATWLMPKKVRRCLYIPDTLILLKSYPLFEELRLPPPSEWTVSFLRSLGQTVYDTFRKHRTAWEADAFRDDALEDRLGTRAALLRDRPGPYAAQLYRDAGLAALGGFVAGVAAALEQVKALEEIRPHQLLDKAAAEGSTRGADLQLAEQRKELQVLNSTLSELAR